ncbi:EscF/YscF/HrpA family type III secretion system needle major subunit [Pandoraea iniqua]|uniref:EscF/YscF/HrpA family type III secretion system needle major subunit n=1 Tax=Pandoraea iniqua TaxID=2508288 RepID=A0A5E4S2T2_9BURK|nr:type III secretion system needle filament subunit SctF [Pandoraea iniqua]VVD64139.1 EscF/YscF/HrpA family type III secretion system needle major subunit [Pandoraea iniqua]VVD68398.1 EscF/YscF/HrpA family type III secretion system needle major subunit [Pandoraea iniqua]
MTTINAADDLRSLEKISASFDEKAKTLKQRVDEALAAIQGDASDAQTLAKYQAVLGEYTLVQSAQSASVKTWRDTAAGIIQKF